MGNAFRIGLRLTEGGTVEDSYKNAPCPLYGGQTGCFSTVPSYRPQAMITEGGTSEREPFPQNRQPPMEKPPEKEKSPYGKIHFFDWPFPKIILK